MNNEYDIIMESDFLIQVYGGLQIAKMQHGVENAYALQEKLNNDNSR